MLAELGRLPQWPQDAEHILDLESCVVEWIKHQDDRGKVDGRCLCISIFSHRWSRPSLDPAEAHPDTVDHKKAAALQYQYAPRPEHDDEWGQFVAF